MVLRVTGTFSTYMHKVPHTTTFHIPHTQVPVPPHTTTLHSNQSTPTAFHFSQLKIDIRKELGTGTGTQISQ